MTDDRTKRGRQDRSLISLTEDYEVAYWTKKFGLSRDQLAEAVKNVGHSAKAVEEYINGSTVR